MALKTITPNGQAIITVPATESIAISNYGGGIASIYYLITDSNRPPAYQLQQTLENSGVVLGAFAAGKTVKIEAGGSTVVYDVGASPDTGIGDADTLNGMASDTGDTADTIVARDSSGDITANAFESTVATGTAPLTVASTTKVTNLNADLLDGVENAAMVHLAGTETITGAKAFSQNVNVLGQDIISGTTWTSRTSVADNSWQSICYGNGLFVSVSSTGTGNRVMTSPDGINWTSRTSAADNDWRSICYGNGIFVAVSSTGTGNRVMTSPDGINWTSRTSAADNSWRSVCYGNGLFVAVATSGTGDRVMTSPDGITWTSRTSAADNSWFSVCYGNGLFVAISYTGTGDRVMTSPDGINWTSRTSAADNSWRSVCYGNGLFVSVSATGTGDRVMTSPDGVTWTLRTSAVDNSWYSVCYGNGLFVATSISGTGDRVMTSPDGITWTSRTSAADIDWFSVCYGNGLFVAISYSGTGNRVMTSGIEFEHLELDPNHSHTDIAGQIIWYEGNTKLQFKAQGAPTAQTTDDTLTAAELDARIITVNQGAAGTSSQTLPLATDMDSYFTGVSNDFGFEFSVINISTNAAEDCTIITNTGWTLVGEMTVESNDADRARSSGRFFARKTGTGAWTLYRIA